MNSLLKAITANKTYLCIIIACASVILAGAALLIAVLLMGGNGASVKKDTSSGNIASLDDSGSKTSDVSDESSSSGNTSGSSTSVSPSSSKQPQSSSSSGNSSTSSAVSNDTVKNYNAAFNFENGSRVNATIGLVNSREALNAAYPTGAAYPESTPIFFNTGGSNYITVTSAWSVLMGYESGRKPADLFDKNLTFVVANNWWITTDTLNVYGAATAGKVTAPTTESFNATSYWNEGVPYWKRCYNGVFDIVTANVGGKEYLFSINHGENKNEQYPDGRRYINTIQPRPASGLYPEGQYSGVGPNGVYDDYANGYYAFTSLNVMPAADFKNGVRFDDAKYDKGPILWPSNGYLDSANNRLNPGMRHPSLFASDGNLYVYYVDGDSIRVARAPLSSLGDPSSFKIYANGSFSMPSLPSGFDKNSRNFFKTGTGNSAQILKGSRSVRFSVSKLEGTEYYLGVEEYFTTWPAGGIKLRLSKDLANWSDGYILPGYSWSDYNKGYLHYPMIYNDSLTSKESVNPKGFYIVGQYGNNIGKARTDRQKISITIK